MQTTDKQTEMEDLYFHTLEGMKSRENMKVALCQMEYLLSFFFILHVNYTHHFEFFETCSFAAKITFMQIIALEPISS